MDRRRRGRSFWDRVEAGVQEHSGRGSDGVKPSQKSRRASPPQKPPEEPPPYDDVEGDGGPDDGGSSQPRPPSYRDLRVESHDEPRPCSPSPAPDVGDGDASPPRPPSYGDLRVESDASPGRMDGDRGQADDGVVTGKPGTQGLLLARAPELQASVENTPRTDVSSEAGFPEYVSPSALRALAEDKVKRASQDLSESRAVVWADGNEAGGEGGAGDAARVAQHMLQVSQSMSDLNRAKIKSGLLQQKTQDSDDDDLNGDRNRGASRSIVLEGPEKIKREYNPYFASNGFDWVVVFPSETKLRLLRQRNKLDKVARGKTGIEIYKERMRIIRAWRESGLEANEFLSTDGMNYLVLVTASEDELEYMAEKWQMRLKVRKNPSDTTAVRYRRFDRQHRGEFEGCDMYNGPSVFKPIERLRLIQEMMSLTLQEYMMNKYGDAWADGLNGAFRCGIIADYFPKHEAVQRDKLYKRWMNIFRSEPVTDIRHYYGERVAFCYSFWGYLTRCQIPIAFVGVLLTVAEFVDPLATLNWANPLFAVLVGLWFTVVIERWKQIANGLAWKWNAADYVKDEKPRPEFKGEKRVNKETGEMDIVYSHHKRFFLLYPLSFVGMGLLGLLVFPLLVAMIVIDAEMKKAVGIWGIVFAGIITGFLVFLLNKFGKFVAYYLTVMENHRYDRQFEKLYATKVVLITCWYMFVPLFYVAFGKGHIPLYKDLGRDKCTPDCMIELGVHTFGVFIVQLVAKHAFDVWMPIGYLCMKSMYKSCCGDWRYRLPKDATLAERLQSQTEKELAQKPYDPFDQYDFMFLQIALICVVGISFPLIAGIAFLSNMVEMGADRWRLTKGSRRRRPESATNIGAWFRCIEIVHFLGMIVGVFMIFFTGNSYLARKPIAEKGWYFLVFEHILICFKLFLAVLVSDKPIWMAHDENEQQKEDTLYRMHDHKLGLREVHKSGVEGDEEWEFSSDSDDDRVDKPLLSKGALGSQASGSNSQRSSRGGDDI